MKKLDAKHIDINRMVKEEKLILNKKRENGSAIVDLAAINRKVNLSYLKTNKPYLILDGHLSHLIRLPIKKVKIVFVVRCDPQILKERLEKRSYPKDKVRENILVEILDICLFESVNRFGKKKICEIETSQKNIEENLKYAMDVLNSNTKPIVGQIDWIALLDSRKMLKEFIE